MVKKKAPLKIADRPAAPRRSFHQPKEFGDLMVREVMGHETADDEINGRGRTQLENVHGLEVDSICGIGRRPRDANRFGIKVNADEIEVQSPPARPAPDRTQQIAVPATDIDYRQRRTVPGGPDRVAEPAQKRVMTKERLIEIREVAQDTLEIGWIQISAIQPLGLVAPMREVK